MRTIVSYDITDDKRRRKISKILGGYGFRVQYSVYECELDVRKIADLRKRLKPLVKSGVGESVRFYLLCADCAKRVKVLGTETAQELGPVVII